MRHLHVARTHSPEGDTVAVCVDRTAALAWLVDQIGQRDWAAFLDALPADQRGGMPRDLAAVAPEDALRFYHGDSENPGEWGSGLDYYVTVTVEPIHGLADDRDLRITARHEVAVDVDDLADACGMVPGGGRSRSAFERLRAVVSAARNRDRTTREDT